MSNIYFIKNIIRNFFLTRHFTIKRSANLITAFYLHYFSRNPVVKSYPIKLVIDTGNICMLKCPLCPTGQGKKTRQKSMLKFEDFKKVVDEVKSHIYEIDLYNWGEPFLNKDLYKIIEYAAKSNIKTHVNSNLNVKKNYLPESIVKSGLEHLTVSLDGASAETYKKYKVGGDFDLVMTNMKAIVDAKKKLKSKHPIVTWQFLIMRHNEHEIKRAKRIAKKIGVDEINFRPVRCDTSSEITMSDKEKIESTKEWLPKQEKYSRYNYKKKRRKSRLKRCLFLKTTMLINANGSVSPCCGVYDEKYDFGNAFHDGVRKVWNNEIYRKARRAVSRRDSSNKRLICSFCIENGFLEY